MRKFLARVKTNIRKNYNLENKHNILQWDALKINRENRTVKINCIPIKLTKSEFDILSLLMFKENKVFSREELLYIIQEYSAVTDRVIDVHINKLRQKLDKYKKIIETVHGVGYVARRENISANI